MKHVVVLHWAYLLPDLADLADLADLRFLAGEVNSISCLFLVIGPGLDGPAIEAAVSLK
jgi:hypothetical protein